MDAETKEAIGKAIAAGQKLSDDALIKIGRKAVEFVLAHKHAIALNEQGLAEAKKLKSRVENGDWEGITGDEVVNAMRRAFGGSDAATDARTKLAQLQATVEALLD